MSQLLVQSTRVGRAAPRYEWAGRKAPARLARTRVGSGHSRWMHARAVVNVGCWSACDSSMTRLTAPNRSAMIGWASASTVRTYPSSKLVVGWHERVALPEWGVSAIRAKIDTGARSSALHVDNVVAMPGRRVRFDLVASESGRRRHIETSVVRAAHVRSSSGHGATRFFVRTLVRLGTLEREVELSLVDRSEMRFPMLLGRTALSGVLVDPTRTRVLRKSPRG